MTRTELLETHEQQLSYWLLFSFLPGIGPVKGLKLRALLGHPKQLFSLSYAALNEQLPDKLSRLIATHKNNNELQSKLNNALAWLRSSEAHHILTPDSELYPKRLKEISDAPIVLYVTGNVHLLSEPQIGVVGSRRPTPQGRRIAHDICEQLVRSGLVITSGLAMGIDTAAHQGALNCYGGTVAVLGTGIDLAYPRSNSVLHSLIADQGVLVSEFPLGTQPSPGNFPRRNRIISGLSLGVLVIEAAVDSGSLISARLAAEQGRDVFAVPGSVINPLSRGCHRLIRDGAVLVETAEDVLIELKSELELELDHVQENEATTPETPGSDRSKVIEAMGFEVINIDLISQLSGISCQSLSVLLTEMELDGVIESTPGGFIRIH